MATDWIIAFDKRPEERTGRDVEAIGARLRRLENLSRIPGSVVQQLATRGYYEDLEPDITIFRHGESGVGWYAVLAGNLEVRLSQPEQTPVTLCSLRAGATFGEEILKDLSRDSAVVTKTTCELLRIPFHDFRMIWEKNKDLMMDLLTNYKIKNGFGSYVSKTAVSPPSPPSSGISQIRTSSPEKTNPADPITETPSMAMARAGWVLRTLLLNEEKGILRDRKTGGVIARRCASGSDLVDWLVSLDPRAIPTRQVAVGMWQALLEEGVISHVSGEHPFKDKCILYHFWQDREGAMNKPTVQDVAEAEEHLDESITELLHRQPDATLRMILRKQSFERSPEELEMIYEELLHLRALSHLSHSVKRELAAVIKFEAHPVAGQTLFRQGEDGKSWYIILQGSVDVVIYGKGTVTSLHAGDDFGKLALVNNVPRAASIVLREDNCQFLRVDKEDFNRILKDLEANTVRLKEHGKDVLILERMSTPQSHYKYTVVAGTPQKMLEHLLETRLGGGVSAGSTIDPCLDDFLLTHIVFFLTRSLVQELNKHYHADSVTQDRDFLMTCRRKVVQFVYQWVVTIRHPVFDDPTSQNFIEDLAATVESDSGQTEEASLMHRVMSLLRRYQQDTSVINKWKLPPTGQPVTLFSDPVDGKKLSNVAIRPNDEIIFRVYCADHTYCTLRFPISATAEQIKVSAAEKLGLKHQASDLLLVEVTTAGEKVPLHDSIVSVPTALTLNGRLFISPKDHLDALTCVPEQETAVEGMEGVDMEFFSTRELAYHLTMFDWDLFWCVHEYELLYHTFGKHRFQQITANLDVFLRRFNEIQYWVITEICMATSISKRVQILRKMIKLAAYCKGYRNLNAFFAVIMGLSNVAVSRLSLTWEKLPSKSRKLFTELEALTDPGRNHRAYRTAVGKLQSPFIPFMPLILKDMAFVHEGNKTIVDGLVNFEKMHMLGQIMRTLRYCRNRHLVLEPPSPKNENEAVAYVRGLRTLNNQRALTSLSNKLEPRRS
nr:PREDICTED: rap guanine nucleotide exchange factor 4 [Bemisia tabaci]